jgi:hypothetical protein
MRGWRNKVNTHLSKSRAGSSCPQPLRTRVDCSHQRLAHTLTRGARCASAVLSQVLVQRRMRARDAGRCNCLSACLPAPTTSAAPAEAATSTTTTTTRRYLNPTLNPLWKPD